jgi:hypothetical protein
MDLSNPANSKAF